MFDIKDAANRILEYDDAEPWGKNNYKGNCLRYLEAIEGFMADKPDMGNSEVVHVYYMCCRGCFCRYKSMVYTIALNYTFEQPIETDELYMIMEAIEKDGSEGIRDVYVTARFVCKSCGIPVGEYGIGVRAKKRDSSNAYRKNSKKIDAIIKEMRVPIPYSGAKIKKRLKEEGYDVALSTVYDRMREMGLNPRTTKRPTRKKISNF